LDNPGVKMPRIHQAPNQPKDAYGALLVYGAGGHGLVVADAAAAAGWRVLGYADNNPKAKAGGPWPLLSAQALAELGEPGEPGDPGVAAIVAIGDNLHRQRLAQELVQQGRTLATVIHPGARVSSLASLGRGVYVGPGAIINAGAEVGDGAIINSGAIVEHHCRIGPYAHLAPGAALGGNVRIGALTLIGLGARVLPVVGIGERCIIGAGAVVIRDVGDGHTLVGVPARPIGS
jgi:sugar O-acyltransferase (sialic acid O-acetyltransferase NeuD family)